MSPALQQRIAKDTQDCRRTAESVVGLNGRSSTIGRQTTRTATIGFAASAAGALAGASKDLWQRARAGAAAGAAGALVKSLLEWNDPDDVHQEYVERCMKERGHDVLGWR